MKRLFLTIIFILFAATLYAKTATITFVWDKNTETDLAGYNLYESQTSNSYTETPVVVIMADANQHVYVTDVTNDVPIYYVITAFDTADNESGYSNEVTYTYTDTNAPDNPEQLKITVIVIVEQ